MSGGGSLGISKSKSFQESQSTSDSFGVSGSESGDVSNSSSSQNIAFSDLYSKLFGGATDSAMAGIASGPQLGAAAKGLFSGGLDLFDNLQGQDIGSSYMTDRLSSQNPVLNQQIAALGGDASKLFREQLLPAIQQSGVETGTLGNDREGVATAQGMDYVTQDFLKNATALRANDVNRRDSIAAQIAGNTLQGASTGLGALPTLMDTLINSESPELGIYANLAKILGGPTVLGTSQSVAQAFSKSFGQQGSKSQSTGSGGSKSNSFSTSGYGGVGASGSD